jgi:hypothetical protein
MEKTENEEKLELIKSFGDLLDKNTSARHEVVYVFEAILAWSEYLAQQRFSQDESFTICARTIEDIIEKAKYPLHVKQFQGMVDTTSAALIIAGQSVEAITIISRMEHNLIGLLEN